MKLENYFEDPKRVKKIKIGFCIVAALLVVSDFFIPKEHAVFHWDGLPGFYALFGFLATLLIIIVAKILGRLFIMKKEDYYRD